MFDHWELMGADPLQAGSQTNTIVLDIRKRKVRFVGRRSERRLAPGRPAPLLPCPQHPSRARLLPVHAAGAEARALRAKRVRGQAVSAPGIDRGDPTEFFGGSALFLSKSRM